MKFLFLDDARQPKPKRERMGALVGVGGFYIDASLVRHTENQIERICAEIGLSKGEMFKWSPRPGERFREVSGEQRRDFFLTVIDVLKESEAKTIVSICDKTKKKADARSPDSEIDALILTLERFHLSVQQDDCFVILAKPSGGRKDENRVLADCFAAIESGTDYIDFGKFSQPPVIMPSARSRLLQAADIIASVATAMVAGNEEYASEIFPALLNIIATDWRGLKGNAGLKLHPNVLYKNVYYWVLNEDFYAKGSGGYPLPEKGKPYFIGPKEY